MNSSAFELNIDALVSPSHSYGGLSSGNLPSMESRGISSNPRAAALQGLAKMKRVMDFGIKQAFLPPHERPYLPLLRQIGFEGTLSHMFDSAKRKVPWIFPYIFSSSGMWAANAATVTPSIDSVKKKVQFTPANLTTHLHRSLEPSFTSVILQKMFPNPIFFEHHAPLPSTPLFSDEGAANSLRLSKTDFGPGIHLFVYGESRIQERPPGSWEHFRPRQSKEAVEALATLHGIYDKQVVFAEQTRESIELGAFHNDLISTGHLSFFLLHERAFQNQNSVLYDLETKLENFSDTELIVAEIKSEVLTIEEALATFFFNSQILSRPDGGMILLAPMECQNHPKARKCIDDLLAERNNPLKEVYFIDLKESLQNGGGPGCLRLRVILNENEFSEMDPRFLLTEAKHQKLVTWVKKRYRDRLELKDLFDPKFALDCQEALNELTELLGLGPIYSFQRKG